jgi:predicted transcriptional regulator
MNTTDERTNPALEPLVAEIVSSYLAKNQLAASYLPRLITAVYETLQSLGKTAEPEPPTPAVPIRQSVQRDYVVCLECGWRGITLRRHLASRHGLSPSEYRSRWNLPPGHVLTAPAYSARRSEFAKGIGWGRRSGRGRRRGRRSRAARPSTT